MYSEYKFKVPGHRLETVTGKWQGNCTLLHDSCPISTAATFSRPGRIGHLLCAASIHSLKPCSVNLKPKPNTVSAFCITVNGYVITPNRGQITATPVRFIKRVGFRIPGLVNTEDVTPTEDSLPTVQTLTELVFFFFLNQRQFFRTEVGCTETKTDTRLLARQSKVKSVSQSVSRLVSQSPRLSVSQSVSLLARQWKVKSVSQSVRPSVSQSVGCQKKSAMSNFRHQSKVAGAKQKKPLQEHEPYASF